MAWHDKLRVALLDAGYTAERLAEVFGFHVNTAKNYLDGKTQPRYDMLYALCRLAGVSSDWVLDDDRPMIGDLQTNNPRGQARPTNFEVVDDPDQPRGSRGRVMVVLSLGPPLPETMVRPKVGAEFWGQTKPAEAQPEPAPDPGRVVVKAREVDPPARTARQSRPPKKRRA